MTNDLSFTDNYGLLVDIEGVADQYRIVNAGKYLSTKHMSAFITQSKKQVSGTHILDLKAEITLFTQGVVSSVTFLPEIKVNTLDYVDLTLADFVSLGFKSTTTGKSLVAGSSEGISSP